jgi:hypothetical protein
VKNPLPVNRRDLVITQVMLGLLDGGLQLLRDAEVGCPHPVADVDVAASGPAGASQERLALHLTNPTENRVNAEECARGEEFTVFDDGPPVDRWIVNRAQ